MHRYDRGVPALHTGGTGCRTGWVSGAAFGGSYGQAGSGTRHNRRHSEGDGLSRAIWHTAIGIMTFDVDGGGLRFVHADGQVGVMFAEDMLNGRMRVVDERTQEVGVYESIEALVLGGWSIAAPIAPRFDTEEGR